MESLASLSYECDHQLVPKGPVGSFDNLFVIRSFGRRSQILSEPEAVIAAYPVETVCLPWGFSSYSIILL